MQINKRSQEIDFLRGIAVMLVLCAHHWIVGPLTSLGWFGVDLFFVLSGFLVSGLLFVEYRKYGNIKPKLFLIRRGFKIYPLFYFSIFVSVIILSFFPDIYLFDGAKKLILNRNGIMIGFATESLFLQSLLFGYWPHHWSLSVEEFFYFSLVVFLFFMIKKHKLQNARLFLIISLGIFITCLGLRLYSNLVYPHHTYLNFKAVYLRIDSLFFGVLIAYFYYFKHDQLSQYYHRYRKIIMAMALSIFLYFPFYKMLSLFFLQTVGFTLIFLAFGCLLLVFLFEKELPAKIRKVIGARLFKGVAMVGFYSYSIYLFHYYIVRYLTGDLYPEQQYRAGNYTYGDVLISFSLYFLGSIGLGILMSYLIEMPMLKVRDKYFPRRTG